MSAADILRDVPNRIILDKLVGPARWRLRWLVGDVVNAAVELGRGARELARRRKADAKAAARAAERAEAPAPEDTRRLANLPRAMRLLSQAVAWASIVMSGLYLEARGGRGPRPHGAAPLPADARPRTPEEIAAAETAAERARQAAADPVRIWAAVEARLRAQQAREDRRALAAMLEKQKVTDVIAQICDDVTAAAEELGAPRVAEEVATIVRKVAVVFGLAPEAAPEPEAPEEPEPEEPEPEEPDPGEPEPAAPEPASAGYAPAAEASPPHGAPHRAPDPAPDWRGSG